MTITNFKLYYRVMVIKNKQKHGTSINPNTLIKRRKLGTWM